MTQSVRDAIAILNRLSREVAVSFELPVAQRSWWSWFLVRATRHLAYPDRDIYPKTRRGTKGAPIVRK